MFDWAAFRRRQPHIRELNLSGSRRPALRASSPRRWNAMGQVVRIGRFRGLLIPYQEGLAEQQVRWEGQASCNEASTWLPVRKMHGSVWLARQCSMGKW